MPQVGTKSNVFTCSVIRTDSLTGCGDADADARNNPDTGFRAAKGLPDALCASCHSNWCGQYYNNVVDIRFDCLESHHSLKFSNAALHFTNLDTPAISAVTASAAINSRLQYLGRRAHRPHAIGAKRGAGGQRCENGDMLPSSPCRTELIF
jgi:hypothetical protein